MSTERSPGDRHWDPAAELAGGSGLLFWALVAIALCVTSSGPLWHRVRGGLSLRAGGWRFVPDFFQDYASARNYYNGLDVYTDHDITLRLYVDPGLKVGRGPYTFGVNAHPPTSILLALPLTRFDFRTAHFTWNMFSLLLLAASIALVFRQLEVPWALRALAPTVAMVFLSNALWENLLNGQYGCILLYLLVVVWAADRSGRPILAGTALGLATVIKVFPVIMFAYLVMRKRWAAVLAGLVTVERKGDKESPKLSADLPFLSFSEARSEESDLGGNVVQRKRVCWVALSRSPPAGTSVGAVTVEDPWDPTNTKKVNVLVRTRGP